MQLASVPKSLTCSVPRLREALKQELKIETKTSTVSKKKVA